MKRARPPFSSRDLSSAELRRAFKSKTLTWLSMQMLPDAVAVDTIRGIQVETGAVCQLRCPFCPTANGHLALSREFLTPAKFTNILDRLGPEFKDVLLYHWGEPLLNPSIHALIALAASRGMETFLATNLSLRSFDARQARLLVTSGLSAMWVACDGASPETYRIYRRGGDFHLVMRNLRLLISAKRNESSPTPRIIWRFLVHKGNERELPRASRAARRLGVEILFDKLGGITPELEAIWEPDAEVLRRGIGAGDSQAGQQTRRAVDTIDDACSNLCLQAWTRPVIRPDGMVLPCSAISDPRYSLGNLFETPIMAIWNSPLTMAIRRYLRSGTDTRRSIPCRQCRLDPNRAANLRAHLSTKRAPDHLLQSAHGS